MDRRVFLKATGASLVHPAGLLAFGPALVRQGNRRLKDITPDELMELLVWAEIDAEDVTTLKDAQRERGKPITSLHPQYYFEYCEGEPAAGRQNIDQCNSSATKQRKKIPRICCGVLAIFLSLRFAKAFSSALVLA